MMYGLDTDDCKWLPEGWSLRWENGVWVLHDPEGNTCGSFFKTDWGAVPEFVAAMRRKGEDVVANAITLHDLVKKGLPPSRMWLKAFREQLGKHICRNVEWRALADGSQLAEEK